MKRENRKAGEREDRRVQSRRRAAGLELVDAVIEKPGSENRFGESAYVLCWEVLGAVPFVGWYNHKTGNWVVAHYRASSDPVPVRYWAKLP